VKPPPLDRLLAIERQLDRSFVVSVVLVLLFALWPVYLRITGQEGIAWGGFVLLALGLALLASYVWFAVTATLAARSLGGAWIPYLAWLLLAPLFSCLPIPFVSLLLAASPLSLKFLLSGQLRSEIHRRTFAEADA
jgi:glycerol-3-phosphate acyltransferase PlsY